MGYKLTVYIPIFSLLYLKLGVFDKLIAKPTKSGVSFTVVIIITFIIIFYKAT